MNLSFQSYNGSTKTINYAHYCSTSPQNNPQEHMQKISTSWIEITRNYWMWNISPHTQWPFRSLHGCNWITRSHKCYKAASNNHVRQIVILIILQANCGIFVVFPRTIIFSYKLMLLRCVTSIQHNSWTSYGLPAHFVQ